MTPNGKPSRKLKIPCANNTCGFDPHHRHKKKLPQLVWGSFLFICGVCAGRTARPCLAGRAISPAGCRSVRGRPPPPVTSPSSSGEFLFYLRRVRGSNSTDRISDKEHNGLGVHIKTEKQKLPHKNAVRQLLLFICCVPCVCRQFHSTLFHSRRGAFLPAVFVAAVLPSFSGKDCLFCRKGVLWPGKSAEMRFRPFILPFLTAFTMFFTKKTLQTNFKNLLYNYGFNFFTQIVSYRFVWGSWVCAFRTASALR